MNEADTLSAIGPAECASVLLIPMWGCCERGIFVGIQCGFERDFEFLLFNLLVTVILYLNIDGRRSYALFLSYCFTYIRGQLFIDCGRSGWRNNICDNVIPYIVISITYRDNVSLPLIVSFYDLSELNGYTRTSSSAAAATTTSSPTSSSMSPSAAAASSSTPTTAAAATTPTTSAAAATSLTAPSSSVVIATLTSTATPSGATSAAAVATTASSALAMPTAFVGLSQVVGVMAGIGGILAMV